MSRAKLARTDCTQYSCLYKVNGKILLKESRLGASQTCYFRFRDENTVRVIIVLVGVVVVATESTSERFKRRSIEAMDYYNYLSTCEKHFFNNVHFGPNHSPKCSFNVVFFYFRNKFNRCLAFRGTLVHVSHL